MSKKSKRSASFFRSDVDEAVEFVRELADGSEYFIEVVIERLKSREGGDQDE